MKKIQILKNGKQLVYILFSVVFFMECTPEKKEPFFKLSLAQWSFNQWVEEGKVSPYEFARLASAWEFEGIEYVSQLYYDVRDAEDRDAALAEFVAKSKQESEKYGIENVLIMIDDEGDLSDPDPKARNQAIANHIDWVKAASALGCSSVRVNLKGTDDVETWKKTSILGLTKLAKQAAPYNINVIVENHGGLSSNAGLLMEVINAINLPNCGTLPDFGNFCLESDWGGINGDCPKKYPIYKGVEEMLTKAFAVSAKSYEFDSNGNEVNIDYAKMLKLVRNAGYTGFIGVEYEGNKLAEPEGIAATRNLLLQTAQNLN